MTGSYFGKLKGVGRTAAAEMAETAETAAETDQKQ